MGEKQLLGTDCTRHKLRAMAVTEMAEYLQRVSLVGERAREMGGHTVQ